MSSWEVTFAVGVFIGVVWTSGGLENGSERFELIFSHHNRTAHLFYGLWPRSVKFGRVRLSKSPDRLLSVFSSTERTNDRYEKMLVRKWV